MEHMANEKYKAEIARNRLSEFRKKSGLTQQEVAARLGVTTASIDRWEKGLGLPNLRHLLHIGVIYDAGAEILYSAMYKKAGDEISKRKKQIPT
jgi:transcriptional regulator with XRE-family HTH domain